MTKNRYTHDGVTYIGLSSYNFGEMLYKIMSVGSCSIFRVSVKDYADPSHPIAQYFSIKAYSLDVAKKWVDNHMAGRGRTTTFMAIKVDQTLISCKPEWDSVKVNLCKAPRGTKRRIIL